MPTQSIGKGPPYTGDLYLSDLWQHGAMMCYGCTPLPTCLSTQALTLKFSDRNLQSCNPAPGPTLSHIL